MKYYVLKEMFDSKLLYGNLFLKYQLFLVEYEQRFTEEDAVDAEKDAEDAEDADSNATYTLETEGTEEIEETEETEEIEEPEHKFLFEKMYMEQYIDEMKELRDKIIG